MVASDRLLMELLIQGSKALISPFFGNLHASESISQVLKWPENSAPRFG